jgi:GTPase SAR1 family protein
LNKKRKEKEETKGEENKMNSILDLVFYMDSDEEKREFLKRILAVNSGELDFVNLIEERLISEINDEKIFEEKMDEIFNEIIDRVKNEEINTRVLNLFIEKYTFYHTEGK